LKSASELLSNDMIYCGVASNSKDQNDGDDDNSDDDTAEVFFGVDDARLIRLSLFFLKKSSFNLINLINFNIINLYLCN